MDYTKKMLNEVLVKIFNTIMFNEEAYLKDNLNQDITIRGVHTLEAIDEANKENDASMGNIASHLMVTAGSLTVLIKKLEVKGYITRTQSKQDKRSFNITLTKKGEKVLNIHTKYHQEMIDMITRNLSKKEEENLIDLLSKIKYYFS